MSPVTSSVIVALITGAVSLIGTVITVLVSNSNTQVKIHAELEKHNAVQDTKIEELTREVREHNNFAKRMPVLEERFAEMERRLTKLEESKA